MSVSAALKSTAAPSRLIKVNPAAPALSVQNRDIIVVTAGTVFGDHRFDRDAPVTAPAGGFVAGRDYAVLIEGGVPHAADASDAIGEAVLGGFHFAPGGNAPARAGGDAVPAINPCSVWDQKFRPTCRDPRAMTLVSGKGGLFWCDIYLLAKDHLRGGTSQFGAVIADGDDPPENPAGGRFDELNYRTAVDVMKHHGKSLLSVDEFFAAAIGVTEKTARRDDPRVTGLDASRTSRSGLMQATGNLWVWGHDGDPDEPRPSVFGGSWIDGSRAGSRYATLDCWPGFSAGRLGARGRSDHLQLD